jgi:hypothetical protein
VTLLSLTQLIIFRVIPKEKKYYRVTMENSQLPNYTYAERLKIVARGMGNPLWSDCKCQLLECLECKALAIRKAEIDELCKQIDLEYGTIK